MHDLKSRVSRFFLYQKLSFRTLFRRATIPTSLSADLSGEPSCSRCGAFLMFSARERGDGLCGPCSRSTNDVAALRERKLSPEDTTRLDKHLSECEACRRLVASCDDRAAFVDGELSELERFLFVDHLDNCAECRSELGPDVRMAVVLDEKKSWTPPSIKNVDEALLWAPSVGEWCSVDDSDPLIGGPRNAQIIGHDTCDDHWNVRISRGEHGSTDHWFPRARLSRPIWPEKKS